MTNTVITPKKSESTSFPCSHNRKTKEDSNQSCIKSISEVTSLKSARSHFQIPEVTSKHEVTSLRSEVIFTAKKSLSWPDITSLQYFNKVDMSHLKSNLKVTVMILPVQKQKSSHIEVKSRFHNPVLLRNRSHI